MIEKKGNKTELTIIGTKCIRDRDAGSKMMKKKRKENTKANQKRKFMCV